MKFNAGQKAKVLMLITNSGIGGAERVFYEHAANFAEKYSITECYFSLDQGLSPNGSINEVISLQNLPAEGVIRKIINLYERVRKLNQLKENNNYQVCISHMDGANWVNVLSRKSSIKTITCIHGSFFSDGNRGRFFKKIFLNNLIVPFIYRRANVVVCVSNKIKVELEKLIGKSSHIISIPNFFDIAKIQNLAASSLPPDFNEVLDSYEVLVAIGRLAPEKNYLSLIKIFEKVKQNRSSVKLFLIGAGPEEYNIIKQIQHSGLTYQKWFGTECLNSQVDVFLLGLQSNPFPILVKCQILLLTSYNEGFPLVLGESMACSVPVIAYDCISGPREILAPELSDEHILKEVYKSKYGILLPPQRRKSIEPDEIENWVKAINFYLNEKDYRDEIVANAIARANYYSKDKVIEQWYELINSMINNI